MNYITIEVKNSVISDLNKERIKEMCTSQFYVMTELKLDTMFPRNNLFFDRLNKFKEHAIVSKINGKQYKNGILSILQKPEFVDWTMFFGFNFLSQGIEIEILDVIFDVNYITILNISNKYYEAIPSKSKFTIITSKKYNLNKEISIGNLTNMGFGRIKIF